MLPSDWENLWLESPRTDYVEPWGGNYWADFEYEFAKNDVQMVGIRYYVSDSCLAVMNSGADSWFSVWTYQDTGGPELYFYPQQPLSRGRGLYKWKAGWNDLFFEDWGYSPVQFYRGQHILIGHGRAPQTHTMSFCTSPPAGVNNKSAYQNIMTAYREDVGRHIPGYWWMSDDLPKVPENPLTVPWAPWATTTQGTLVAGIQGIYKKTATTNHDTGIINHLKTHFGGNLQGAVDPSYDHSAGNIFYPKVSRIATHLEICNPANPNTAGQLEGELSLWEYNGAVWTNKARVTVPFDYRVRARVYQFPITPVTVTPGTAYMVAYANTTTTSCPLYYMSTPVGSVQRDATYFVNGGFVYDAYLKGTNPLPLASTPTNASIQNNAVGMFNIVTTAAP
jgi:hypothetical protein